MTSSLSEHKHQDCLGIALAKRDAYTAGHCCRVEALSTHLGQLCKLNVGELSVLRVAARLHDVGKIGIPDRILLKPGRLEPDEWEIMKTHSALGQQIVHAIVHPDAEQIARVVRHHHEAFDGTGYPDGLSGERIPVCSRIILLADSYDAMTSTRHHRHAMPHQHVFDVLRSERGTKFDPVIFDHFESLFASGWFASRWQQ
ncbi:MAG TPA: HD domain-containing phosphohydrolase [Burkholderiales bacterium]|nr:HD domain-containing phosphohydrolase [Burkholderiales bacterium]